MNEMAIKQELLFHMISKLRIEKSFYILWTFCFHSNNEDFFNLSEILEFRKNDEPAETILNAIQILVPHINKNQIRQMTKTQKIDTLDAMGNILIGVFENTNKNGVFDETSRLGMFSIWFYHVNSLTSRVWTCLYLSN